MAHRTTPELVAEIIEIDLDEVDLDPFIDAANQLVTEKCLTSGYSTIRLETIERWLAAHFYSIQDPQPTMEGVSGVQQQFTMPLKPGLRFTSYGQQALRLDTAGNLAAMDNAMDDVTTTLPAAGGVRKVTWLGTELS